MLSPGATCTETPVRARRTVNSTSVSSSVAAAVKCSTWTAFAGQVRATALAALAATIGKQRAKLQYGHRCIQVEAKARVHSERGGSQQLGEQGLFRRSGEVVQVELALRGCQHAPWRVTA